MQIPDFALERYLGRWEFTAPHLLCTSDVEGYKLEELLALGDDETRALWGRLGLGYTEPTGHPLLRREIASLYDGVSPDEIVAFAGAEEAIFVLSNVLLGPGSHAVVLSPAYQALHEVARATGAEITTVALDPERGWALDLEAVRRAIRPNTRVIVANFPNNPTGALPDAATFRALAGVAKSAGAVLLSDEVYRWLEHDPKDRIPAAVEIDEHAISIGVMSKSFGLAGLRIGWIACHDAELRTRAARFKDYTSICNSAPSEILALMGLRARDKVLARSRAIVTSNLALLDKFFAVHAEHFEWTRPHAGTVGFPRLRGSTSGDDFAKAVIDAEGVLLLPGSVYDAQLGSHFRVGFGRTAMPQALERLARFMKSWPRR